MNGPVGVGPHHPDVDVLRSATWLVARKPSPYGVTCSSRPPKSSIWIGAASASAGDQEPPQRQELERRPVEGQIGDGDVALVRELLRAPEEVDGAASHHERRPELGDVTGGVAEQVLGADQADGGFDAVVEHVDTEQRPAPLPAGRLPYVGGGDGQHAGVRGRRRRRRASTTRWRSGPVSPTTTCCRTCRGGTRSIGRCTGRPSSCAPDRWSSACRRTARPRCRCPRRATASGHRRWGWVARRRPLPTPDLAGRTGPGGRRRWSSRTCSRTARS